MVRTTIWPRSIVEGAPYDLRIERQRGAVDRADEAVHVRLDGARDAVAVTHDDVFAPERAHRRDHLLGVVAVVA